MDKERLLARLVQVGTVTAVDREKNTARVKFHDTGIVSAPLRVVQHDGADVVIAPDGAHTHAVTDTDSGGMASDAPTHTHDGSQLRRWTPRVNDAVLVLYLPLDNADGYILGGV